MSGRLRDGRAVSPRPHALCVFLLTALLAASVSCARAADPGVSLTLGDKGLTSLKYGGTEYLWANPGDGSGGAFDGSVFYVSRVVLSKPGQPNVSLERGGPGTVTSDKAHSQITRTYAWGTIRCTYAALGSRLGMTVTVTNATRDQTVKAVYFQPLWLHFPDKPREYDGNSPLLDVNVGRPTILPMSYGTGTVVLCNEDVKRPLTLGFPYALDKPADTQFPILVSAGETDFIHPYMDPHVVRPIAPGHSDTYSLSLRFGPAGANGRDMAADLERKFVAAYPPQLHWTDRRPLGYLMLSSTVPHQASGKNPRGWFLNDPAIDVTTPEGRADFGKRLMDYADGSLKVLKDMNAQGVIVWDIQGQEYPHATSYIGDPRLTPTLAPEIDPFADAFFAKFRAAGLRVGVCLRPQRLVRTPTTVYQQDPDLTDSAPIVQTLLDRARYAHKRWGCTLFYVDSNGDPNAPYDAGIFERVSQTLAHEGIQALLMPEHKNARYYAYTAPYAELRQDHASTPADVRRLYPGAFSVINVADGPEEARHDDLLAAVKRGDILLFRAWWNDPDNAPVKRIYQEAGRKP